MSAYISIHDPQFDRQVSLREAYRIMESFLAAHFDRGEVSTGVLLGYLSLQGDGIAGDPAALYDYLDAVTSVAGPPFESAP
jgi:hypothetical protein